MQEIGVWITEAGPVGATLDFGVQDAGGGEFQLPSWASGALQGAAAGAATGAVAGPYGALIGGALGAVGGGIAASGPPPSPTPQSPPPKAASSAPAMTAAPTAGAPNAAVVQALQQFAAAMPALIQIVAASGTPAASPKRAEAGELPAGGEAVFASDVGSGAEWVLAVNERTWSVP